MKRFKQTVWQRIRPLRWLLIGPWLGVFLSACQTIPAQSTQPTQRQEPLSSGSVASTFDGKWLREQNYFTADQTKLADLSKWQLNAKVAVHTPQVKESANLIWSYQDQSNQLKMFGPLGAGAIRLDFDQYGVQLSDGKGVLHRGDNAEDMLQAIVGWPIPVDALSYWLFSLPHPDFTYEYQLNAEGELSELRQLGWRVSYTNYSERFPQTWGAKLARKINAVRQAADQQAVKVKLVTKSWQP